MAKKREMVHSPIRKSRLDECVNCSKRMIIPLENYWLNTARSTPAGAGLLHRSYAQIKTLLW